MNRCKWVNLKNERYVKYHDQEWGIVSHDDNYLFELLLLEIFQAGLNWELVLNKRDHFRESFDNFDYVKISQYDNEKIDELYNDKNIIRNKRKIEAVVNNAQIFMRIQSEFGSFDKYIWSFTDNNQIIGNGTLTRSELSDNISKNLKKFGMKFVGSTIIYSYLQAIGVINDHEDECFMKRGI